MLSQKQTKPSICLNMIVRDEAKNMPRCLESVKAIVDYYIINDNGSGDGTPELIKQIMDGYGISGEVYSSPWVNFGHNREEALQRVYRDGRWDYCLIIDADAILHYKDGVFDNLTADSYLVEWRPGSIVYKLPSLLSMKSEWHWKGVVHNYISGNGKISEALKDAWIEPITGAGAKSHGLTSQEKFLKDASLLEKELEKNPNDARSRFYLAQSYRDANKPDLAYKNYSGRASMGGWAEEIYESMYQLAMCKWKRDDVFPLDEFLAAYNYRPTRVEPLYQIARYYRLKGMHAIGYIFAKMGAGLPQPDDILFVNKPIYDWMMVDELAVCAYWVGRYEESRELCEKLLRSDLPGREVERVKKNKEYSERELSKSEKAADYYDRLASSDVSRYEEIYKLVGEWAQGRVLDIGCGIANLQHYIENYSGFDFSPESIRLANTNKVWVGNAYDESFDGYDTYVAIEVLEHLDDLRLIRKLPKGKTLIFSVPSFSDPGHIRSYNKDNISQRLDGLLNIDLQVRFNMRGGKWVTENSNTDAYIILCRAVVM